MFQDPGHANNVYAESQAKLFAAIATEDDPQPPDLVEARTQRFTSLVWLAFGLALAAWLVWISFGDVEGVIAGAVAVGVLVAVLVRRRRLDRDG